MQAFAGGCQTDAQDRPTFGLINFCPTRVPTAVDASYQSCVTVGIHELMHVLGTLKVLPYGQCHESAANPLRVGVHV